MNFERNFCSPVFIPSKGDLKLFSIFQVNQAVKNVDDMIGRLVNGIKQRKLSSCVNVIVVADHGMQI